MRIQLHIALALAFASGLVLASILPAAQPGKGGASFRGSAKLPAAIGTQSAQPKVFAPKLQLPTSGGGTPKLTTLPGRVGDPFKGKPFVPQLGTVPGLIPSVGSGNGNGKGGGGLQTVKLPGLVPGGGAPQLGKVPGLVPPGGTPKLGKIPGLVGAIKKVPLCQPYPYPTQPFHCPPCPKWFHNWCWFPGFGGCYGWYGGVCIPTVVHETVIVQMPPVEVIEQGNLPQVVPGTTVALTALNLGSSPGQVILEIGTIALPCQVTEWTPDQLTLTIPVMGLKAETPARMIVLRADGQVARTIDLELVAATVVQK